jgi:hypothetical protein
MTGDLVGVRVGTLVLGALVATLVEAKGALVGTLAAAIGARVGTLVDGAVKGAARGVPVACDADEATTGAPDWCSNRDTGSASRSDNERCRTLQRRQWSYRSTELGSLRPFPCFRR